MAPRLLAFLAFGVFFPIEVMVAMLSRHPDYRAAERLLNAVESRPQRAYYCVVRSVTRRPRAKPRPETLRVWREGKDKSVKVLESPSRRAIVMANHGSTLELAFKPGASGGPPLELRRAVSKAGPLRIVGVGRLGGAACYRAERLLAAGAPAGVSEQSAVRVARILLWIDREELDRRGRLRVLAEEEAGRVTVCPRQHFEEGIGWLGTRCVTSLGRAGAKVSTMTEFAPLRTLPEAALAEPAALDYAAIVARLPAPPVKAAGSSAPPSRGAPRNPSSSRPR